MSLTNVYGFQQAFIDSIEAHSTTQLYPIGTERTHNGNKYVYCYNESTSTIADGLGCCIKTTIPFSVKLNAVDGGKLQCWNVFDDVLTLEYFWGLVKGITPASTLQPTITGVKCAGAITAARCFSCDNAGKAVSTITAGRDIVGILNVAATGADQYRAAFVNI